MVQTGTVAEQAIERLQRFGRAMVAGDADALEELLAPDSNYVHSSAWVEPGSQLIESVRGGRHNTRMDFEDLRVRSYGDTQIVDGLAHLIVGPEDRRIVFDSRFSAVWVGAGDESRLVVYHSTRVPEPDS